MNYKGFTISEDLSGFAPKKERFNFCFEGDGCVIGHGEFIEHCQKQIDELT